MNSARSELASRIYRAAHLNGEFRLRSGMVAKEYFDKYRFESEPALLHAVSEALIPLVHPDTDALAGLELGGIPLATLMSQLCGKPTVFVRKEAKEYGTANLAEGMDIGGQRLCLVEDVVTTGGQLLESASALRGLGATIETAVCVIDREDGAVEALLNDGIQLRALFTKSVLEQAQASTGPPA